MTGDGTVVASIAAGKATNVNGTLNSPSTSTDNVVTYTVTPPTATIDLQDTSDSGISNTDNLTNAVSPVFDVTFRKMSVCPSTAISLMQALPLAVRLQLAHSLAIPIR